MKHFFSLHNILPGFFLLLPFGIPTFAALPQRIVGGDISLLPSYEAVGTPYRTFYGEPISDFVRYAHDSLGWSTCRVRLFVQPTETNPQGNKEGVVQDLGYVVKLGKRIKAAGMAFALDIHYSDTWADPSKQYIPASWQSLTEEQLSDTVYGYTKYCLDSLVRAGATPDYVQIGNEISFGMLWRGTPETTNDKVYPAMSYSQRQSQWVRLTRFLNQGARATRKSCPRAKIILHTERVSEAQTSVNFYSYLSSVDYDIIGLSYYPFWHGWLDTELSTTLEALHTAFPDKPIHIMETAYYNNYWPTDGSIFYDSSALWCANEEGQDGFLHDLISKLVSYSYVQGLYYWFPEENGCGGPAWSERTIVISQWLNRGLFNPTTHCALMGLYRLQEFADPSTGISYDIPSYMLPTKYLHQDQLYIQYMGIIYLSLGQKLQSQ